MDEKDRADAAAALRRLLQAVESGDLTADGPAARALVMRMQGAAEALGFVVPDETDVASRLEGSPRA